MHVIIVFAVTMAEDVQNEKTVQNCTVFSFVQCQWFYTLKQSYGKLFKISNTLLFIFLDKMLVIRTGIHKMLVRIANRTDPDQTASSEAV